MRIKRLKRKPWSKLKKTILVGAIAVSLLSTTFTFNQYNTLSLEQKNGATGKFNMSYLYFANTDTYIEKVDQSGNSLQTVSPSYFDLNKDGSLQEKVDPKFVKAMQARGIKIVPFLSNHWNREVGQAALRNKESLVNEIVTAINKYQLDGVHIDIENLIETDRADYVDLMKLLRDKLPTEKEVSIAVAANPSGINRGWQGSYDYSELAKYSDYLMIMTYDESYYGSKPGPVASISFVEKSVQYALEHVPAEKIVLGIPFYGRYWPKGEKGGNGIDIKRVDELVEQYKGKKSFDENSKSAFAEFTVPAGQKPAVYYWNLDPGTYQVWYENDESLKHKLRLVQKYNLRGTGSWSLNSVPNTIWDFYSSWLNGEHYFIDAENDWAEQDIMAMFNKGWMIGTSEGEFSPTKTLTRAQATVVLVRALGLTKDQEQAPPSQPIDYFIDVTDSYWAKKEIELAYEYKLVEGIGNQQFAPDQTITRAEIAALLGRVLKNKDATIMAATSNKREMTPFDDISPSHWAYEDVVALTTMDIIRGVEENKFQPAGIVTRSQMAALMNRSSSLIIEE